MLTRATIDEPLIQKQKFKEIWNSAEESLNSCSLEAKVFEAGKSISTLIFIFSFAF